MNRTLTLLTTTALLAAAPAYAQAATPTAPAQAAPAQTTPAQAPAYASAAEALAAAKSLQAQAAARYEGASIDRALWRQAANAAEAAVQLAPNSTEALQLRAEIYTQTGFWARALKGWQAYFAAAGTQATPQAREWAAHTYYNLAYAAYTRADLGAAGELLGECLNVAPDNAQCALWAGRVALESGQSAEAAALYRRAAELDPSNKVAGYFASVAGRAAEYGPEATRSFSRGYAELEAGRKEAALALFQQAAAQAPAFAGARREAGKLALELGQLEAAREAYAALVAHADATDSDRYNFRLTEEAAQYGLRAVQMFREGYASYSAGNREAAAAAFAGATQASPAYAKAWAWLGRVQFESGEFAAAAASYVEAARLDPSDRSAAYWLRQAQSQQSKE